MKSLVIIIVILIISNNVKAECSRLDAYAAESITDYLNSWDNVYLFYKQYSNCYDGSIAEGAADKIELLWSEQWSTTPRMLELVEKDEGFKSFIWERIHEEIFPQDRFEHVSNLAKKNCPSGGKYFCSLFIK